MTLRVGILGNGGIAARHAGALARLAEQMTLVAASGRDAERVRAFTDQHGGKPFTRIEDMLDHGIDLLIDTAPPYSRAGESVMAAQAGVHLLVEKPIALDMATADALIASAAKVKAAVGFMYRQGEAVQRWLAEDTGTIGLMTGIYHCNALHAPWWRRREQSGGQVLEQLIHIIDLVRLFMGEPDTVYSRTANLFHRDVRDYDVQDVSAIVFGWDDGRLASLTANNIAVPGQWVKGWSLFAERATAHFSDWNNAAYTRTAPEVAAQDWRSDRDPFVAQLADLAAAIRDDRAPLVPIAEGAATLRLALAAVRAADERRELRVADAL
ncbi:Gfo/Idh/MocA family oxidoreductase [Sphingomonas sp. ID1715]|uniref:Gfo/Idh/MocA family protein n=1 Tax=Sphingomonas sp. ID1715 TaxID=1656898 RepID=UPI00148949FA|nr:Gfo/Idh/MocA family oxidoreductase [Sphingomonas sp. ID1715]NNM76483.1 Gfo/Idh/MocA family oxidoreductase [Sphingomonas sp. ID1715]